MVDIITVKSKTRKPIYQQSSWTYLCLYKIHISTTAPKKPIFNAQFTIFWCKYGAEKAHFDLGLKTALN